MSKPCGGMMSEPFISMMSTSENIVSLYFLGLQHLAYT